MCRVSGRCGPVLNRKGAHTGVPEKRREDLIRLAQLYRVKRSLAGLTREPAHFGTPEEAGGNNKETFSWEVESPEFHWVSSGKQSCASHSAQRAGVYTRCRWGLGWPGWSGDSLSASPLTAESCGRGVCVSRNEAGLPPAVTPAAPNHSGLPRFLLSARHTPDTMAGLRPARPLQALDTGFGDRRVPGNDTAEPTLTSGSQPGPGGPPSSPERSRGFV